MSEKTPVEELVLKKINNDLPPPIKIIIMVIFGIIGFAVTSFKIPDSNNFELTRKAGGEYIDQIIIRYFKFKRNKNKIYTFFTEEKNNE